MTYEDLQKANEAIKTTTLERKDKDGNIVIVIDPGHGGEDGGASSERGLLEKTFALI